MTPHGPDADTYERATGAEAGPHKLDESTLAFMFETDAMPRVTSLAMASQGVERDYYKCWTGLKSAWRDPAEMKGGGATPTSTPSSTCSSPAPPPATPSPATSPAAMASQGV